MGKIGKYVGMALLCILTLAASLWSLNLHDDVQTWLIKIRTSDQEGIVIGTPAPDFSLKDLAGNDIHLEGQRGKVVLITFWATWCSPCRTELSHLQHIYRRYRDKGLEILAISTDSNQEAVQYFWNKNGFTFSALHADKVVQSAYKIQNIPVLYLIDPEGIIRFHHTGYAPGQNKKIEENIEKLLRRKSEFWNIVQK